MKIKPLPDKDYLLSIFTYEDGKLFWIVDRLPAVYSGRRAGKDKKDYRIVMIDGVFYQEHRIIYKMLSDYFDESKLIDHKDCNKKNNNFLNMRLADKYQNMHNQGWQNKNKDTNTKGIDYLKDKSMFRARVQYMGKRIVKSFSVFEDAEKWIKETRASLHKEFSNDGK